MFEREDRQNAASKERGDWMSRVKSTGRRVPMSIAAKQSGFSLIELVITITVLTILTLGVIPLVKVSVRRQKEQQLRDALRQMRTAIDEFHRDTIGMVVPSDSELLPEFGMVGEEAVAVRLLSILAARW